MTSVKPNSASGTTLGSGAADGLPNSQVWLTFVITNPSRRIAPPCRCSFYRIPPASARRRWATPCSSSSPSSGSTGGSSPSSIRWRRRARWSRSSTPPWTGRSHRSRSRQPRSTRFGSSCTAHVARSSTSSSCTWPRSSPSCRLEARGSPHSSMASATSSATTPGWPPSSMPSSTTTGRVCVLWTRQT